MNGEAGEYIMKEIGGYIELEQNNLPMLHDKAIRLNCGRNCLAYIIRAKKIKKILLPKFCCYSIREICKREKVEIRYYSINEFFLPQNIYLDRNEWLYLINYYGQLTSEQIKSYSNQYKYIIVDQAQAYFQKPVKNVDTIYTCRKFFGVPDGAFLYTNSVIKEAFPLDESYKRMEFLMGRFERNASEFYEKYILNDKIFDNIPIKQMSKLTKNLLCGIDYDKIRDKRSDNFFYLHERLKRINKLELRVPDGPFMYPLYICNGIKIREKLKKNKIYIPLLWPNILEECIQNELEYDMASNILPLPVDQRYSYTEMDIIITYIEQFYRR